MYRRTRANGYSLPVSVLLATGHSVLLLPCSLPQARAATHSHTRDEKLACMQAETERQRRRNNSAREQATKLRARSAGFRAAPALLTPRLFIPCSDTVHRSRFPLFSFSLSLTAPEPENLVFFSPLAPAPTRYSCATVWGQSRREPGQTRPKAS